MGGGYSNIRLTSNRGCEPYITGTATNYSTCATTNATADSNDTFTLDKLGELYNILGKTQSEYYSTPYYSTPTVGYDAARGTDSTVSLTYRWNDCTNDVLGTGSLVNYIASSPTYDIYDNSIGERYLDEKTKLASKIRDNLAPAIHVRGDGVSKAIPENEQIAIETLREEITEAELRKYLRYGFVLVPGESGKTYQIFRNSWHTKVWSGGKLIEEICVRLSSDAKVPPTDNVIAFKRMIEVDEESFRKCGNVYKMKQIAA